MLVFGTACARGVCDDIVKDGRVDANGVLPSHEIVNDLQHQPIKGVVCQAQGWCIGSSVQRNVCCET